MCWLSEFHHLPHPMADFSPETTIDVPSEIIIRILKTRTLSQQDIRSSRLACKQRGNCGFVAMLRKVTVIRSSEVVFYIDYFQKRSLHVSWVEEIEIDITIQCSNGLANWGNLFTLLPNLAEVHIKNTRLSIFNLPWTSKTTLPLRLTFTNCIITTCYAFNVLLLPHIDSILIVGGDSGYSPRWDDSFSNLGGKTWTDIQFMAFDKLRFNDASDIVQAISECSIKPKAIHWHVMGTCDPIPQSLHIGLVDHMLVELHFYLIGGHSDYLLLTLYLNAFGIAAFNEQHHHLIDLSRAFHLEVITWRCTMPLGYSLVGCLHTLPGKTVLHTLWVYIAWQVLPLWEELRDLLDSRKFCQFSMLHLWYTQRWTLHPNLFDKNQNTYPHTWKLLYVLMPPWKSAMQYIPHFDLI